MHATARQFGASCAAIDGYQTDWGITYGAPGEWFYLEALNEQIFGDGCWANVYSTFKYNNQVHHNMISAAADPLDMINALGFDGGAGWEVDEAATAQKFGSIYVDSTFARVAIGDAGTVNECTRFEMQIPTAWSATSITATVNTGSYSPEQTAWLYVWDKDSEPSNGYPITIGGTSGNPSAPGRPQNMTVREN